MDERVRFVARILDGEAMSEVAQRAMAEFLRRAAAEQPDFPGSDKEKWRAYWTTSFPLRRRADRDHWLEGLRKAGLEI